MAAANSNSDTPAAKTTEIVKYLSALQHSSTQELDTRYRRLSAVLVRSLMSEIMRDTLQWLQLIFIWKVISAKDTFRVKKRIEDS